MSCFKKYELSGILNDKKIKLSFLYDYAKMFNKVASEINFGCNSCLKTYYTEYMKNIDKPAILFVISKRGKGVSLSSTIYGRPHNGTHFVLSPGNCSNAKCQIFQDFHLTVKHGNKIFVKLPTEEQSKEIRQSDEYKSYLEEFNLKPLDLDDEEVDYSKWKLKDLKIKFPHIKAKNKADLINQINQ